jgi:putative endonuclease
VDAPQRAGASGEDLACELLERSGLKIVARNFRTRAGEIDIVAREGQTTVFVEVKERRGAGHGAGFEAVTNAKQRRIVSAARVYAARYGLSETPLRFDVVSVDYEGSASPQLRHDRGAFDVT